MKVNTTRIGKRGPIVIPGEISREYRLEEGSLRLPKKERKVFS